MTILSFAMKRSGHHAVLNWLFHQFNCGVVHHNSLNLSKFINGKIVYKAGRIDMNTYGDGEDIVCYSFENVDPDNIDAAKESSLAKEAFTTITIRDIYNTLASSFNHPLYDKYKKEDFKKLVRIWEKYISVDCDLKINYNSWFANREYRDNICKKFGIVNMDFGLNLVPKNGGGSTFDNVEYSGKAQSMKVGDRWKSFINNRTYWDILSKKSHILNQKYFGWDIYERSKELRNDIYIKTIEESYSDLMNHLNKKERCCYVRFGDNDIFQMVGMDRSGDSLEGRAIGNNKSVWTKELQSDIKYSFSIEEHGYMKAIVGAHKIEKGMLPQVFWPQYDDSVAGYIRGLTEERNFYHATLFHYLYSFDKERFDAIMSHFQGAGLFVGNTVNIYNTFPNARRIETPEKNAYTAYESIYNQIKDLLGIYELGYIILACGQLSRVLSGKLWGVVKEEQQNTAIIDIGSCVDLFDGKKTRYWHKKLGL